MKLWLSKNSEVPIREQIVTQIILGVASGDLRVGQKLPATREIARRYNVHANTVAGAYRMLAAEDWLEFRKGSGFYVREAGSQKSENPLDILIARFLHDALALGFTKDEIEQRVRRFFAPGRADEILLIESDVGFREILAEEIRQATGRKTRETDFEDFQTDHCAGNYIFAAMFDEKTKIRSVLPLDRHCVFLKARSVAGSMNGERRPSDGDLIAVVSGWEKFLSLARTMLVAAKIDADSLIVRNTAESGWRKGLNTASMVICDALTATKISDLDNLQPFYLIADESLEQLKKMESAS